MDLTQDKKPNAGDPAGGRQLLTPQHLAWAGLVLICLLSGVASVFVPAPLIVGVVFITTAAAVCFKFPFVGLLVYMVIFLLRPAELYPVLEPLHIERLVGIFVLISSLVGHKLRSGCLPLPRDRTTVLLLTFCGLMVISWTYSIDQQRSYVMIERFIKLLILYLIIILEVNSRKRFDIFMGVFLFMIFFDTFLSFRDYYGGGARYRMGIYRADSRTSAGGNPNTMATTLACTLPLLVAYFKIHKNILYRAAILGTSGLFLLMISNTGSRAGLMGLIVVMAIMIFHVRNRMAATITVLVLALAGWFALPQQYKGRYATLVEFDRDTDEISSGRIGVWKNGLRMFADRPLTGVGVGAFLTANNSGRYGPPIALQAHSLYIQLLATVGLPGAVIWFMFLASMIIRCRAGPFDPEESELEGWSRHYKNAFIAAIGGLLMASVFGHSLDRYTWYMMAALSLMLIDIETGRSDRELKHVAG